jgi:hypothetical protein
VPFRTAEAVLVLLTDQAADYRALVSMDPALTTVRWQITADKNWSTSRVFVWGEVVVLGAPSGEGVACYANTGACLVTRTSVDHGSAVCC